MNFWKLFEVPDIMAALAEGCSASRRRMLLLDGCVAVIAGC
jgi:hypothetical protein